MTLSFDDHPRISDIESLIVRLEHDFHTGICDASINFGEAKDILVRIKDLKKQLLEVSGATSNGLHIRPLTG